MPKDLLLSMSLKHLTGKGEIVIVNDNAVLQAMVSFPGTFVELADIVFEQILKAERIDFDWFVTPLV